MPRTCLGPCWPPPFPMELLSARGANSFCCSTGSPGVPSFRESPTGRQQAPGLGLSGVIIWRWPHYHGCRLPFPCPVPVAREQLCRLDTGWSQPPRMPCAWGKRVSEWRVTQTYKVEEVWEQGVYFVIDVNSRHFLRVRQAPACRPTLLRYLGFRSFALDAPCKYYIHTATTVVSAARWALPWRAGAVWTRLLGTKQKLVFVFVFKQKAIELGSCFSILK